MSEASRRRRIGAAFSGKRVWVTGASSGIGAAFLDILGAAGVRTIASAPESECGKIDTTDHPTVQVMPFDLTDRSAIGDVVTRVWDLYGGVDVLINNAGISQRSLFAETEPEVLERVLQINLIGTMWLTRDVVRRMIDDRNALREGGQHRGQLRGQHRGQHRRIVVISSYAAWVPVPQRTAYSAAKAALISMCDSLRAELLEHRIGVTAVVPGTVRTAISVNAVTGNGSPHARLDPNQAAGMAPEQCALRILDGVARGRRQFAVAVPPKLLFAKVVRTVAPRLFDRIISKARVT